LLLDSKDFTVLIKNYVEFPKFDQKRYAPQTERQTDGRTDRQTDSMHVTCGRVS